MQVGKAEDVLPKLLEELLGELERVFVVFFGRNTTWGENEETQPDFLPFGSSWWHISFTIITIFTKGPLSNLHLSTVIQSLGKESI